MDCHNHHASGLLAEINEATMFTQIVEGVLDWTTTDQVSNADPVCFYLLVQDEVSEAL